MRKTRPVLERFEEKFMPEPNSGCWLWIACQQGDGKAYGCFYLNGKREQAHRVSVMLYRGVKLGPALVLHKCDNPACVNPGHLKIGTQSENIFQAVARGRHRYSSPVVSGAHNGNSKLTQSQVDAIRACPLPGNQIAKLVGVHPSCISLIKRGLSWRANIDAKEAA